MAYGRLPKKMTSKLKFIWGSVMRRGGDGVSWKKYPVHMLRSVREHADFSL